MHNFERHALYELVFGSKEEPLQKAVITANHPIYDGETNEYRPVKELKKGDTLQTPSGRVKLVEINTLDPDTYFGSQKKVVYDLHMEHGPKNYVADNILIHNKPGF